MARLHNKIKWLNPRLVILPLTVIMLLVTVTVGQAAGGPIFERMITGFNQATNEAYGGGTAVTVNEKSFVGSIVIIINLLLVFLGILFFILMIYAGYLWMIARGNQQEVDKAKKIIREAITAIIIILCARLFTEFILYAIGQAAANPTN